MRVPLLPATRCAGTVATGCVPEAVAVAVDPVAAAWLEVVGAASDAVLRAGAAPQAARIPPAAPVVRRAPNTCNTIRRDGWRRNDGRDRSTEDISVTLPASRLDRTPARDQCG